ncbi:hypothetical protein OEZ85_005016 [Tetradesmus obliquus]|uniref:Plastid lipid-associated protein/fibrillin conserved domain-containing protein n=1 Tax=Tetradesmus obliquus TaxID=3088 RepID=A0ABY8UH13_TETOB|nr:hypothetical protein OEZ85_005016 [Tetradesmus obliquus]
MLAHTQHSTVCPARAPQQQCHRPFAASSRRARLQPVRAAAASVDTDSALSVIKSCVAKPGAVPAPVVLDAMLQLEAAKLPTEGWLELLQAPGTHWRLVFTADEKQVQAAKKKQPNKGGVYFPIAACQKFDAAQADFENGVFLGPIASLTFNGPYAMKGKQLMFDVVKMNIGLGPWRFSIPFKKDAKGIAEMDPQDAKKLPFFLYAYIDRDIVVARGRSGGLAVWQRASKDWEAKAGVLAVYK